MKPRSRAALMASSLFVSCLPLGGCIPGPLIGMTSQTRQNVTQDSLVLPARPAAFVETAAAVGEDLGYKLAGTNKAENSVRFTGGKGMLSSLFLGKNENIVLEVALQPDGRTIGMQIVVVGNFSAAKQEKVEERLREFKDALRERLV